MVGRFVMLEARYQMILGMFLKYDLAVVYRDMRNNTPWCKLSIMDQRSLLPKVNPQNQGHQNLSQSQSTSISWHVLLLLSCTPLVVQQKICRFDDWNWALKLFQWNHCRCWWNLENINAVMERATSQLSNHQCHPPLLHHLTCSHYPPRLSNLRNHNSYITNQSLGCEMYKALMFTHLRAIPRSNGHGPTYQQRLRSKKSLWSDSTTNLILWCY